MDAIAYCDKLEQHLTAWKAKLYDVIRIVDRMAEKEKETVFSSIRGLHAIVDQIDTEVEQLRTACPADWSPNRQNLDRKMAELQLSLKNLSVDVGGPVIPDTLAWVSK
ncbi:MAG: hypothetical protein PVI00_03395 [Desulfobacterales bacterium]|jgi:type II secretory pathway component PulM